MSTYHFPGRRSRSIDVIRRPCGFGKNLSFIFNNNVKAENKIARCESTAKSRFVAGGKYEPVLKDNAYKIHMKLTINSVSAADFGSYKCVSRNSLGDTDGSIKVYRKYNYGTWSARTLSSKIFHDKSSRQDVIKLFVIIRKRDFGIIECKRSGVAVQLAPYAPYCSLLSSSCPKIVGIFMKYWNPTRDRSGVLYS